MTKRRVLELLFSAALGAAGGHAFTSCLGASSERADRRRRADEALERFWKIYRERRP